MPARTEHAPGTPSWTDLQTTDPAAAKAFYAALWGWTYDDLPAGEDAEGNTASIRWPRRTGRKSARSRRCRRPASRRTGART